MYASLCGTARPSVQASYEGRTVAEASVEVRSNTAVLSLPLSEVHLWEVGHGRLYDLVLTYGEDTVKSYFGLRSTAIDGYQILLNRKSVFQCTVLVQGYYPDNITPSYRVSVRQDTISLSLLLSHTSQRETCKSLSGWSVTTSQRTFAAKH